MKTFTVIFELLMLYPVCLFIYQTGIKKVNGDIALKNAGKVLMTEIKFCLKPIIWLFDKLNFISHKKEKNL